MDRTSTPSLYFEYIAFSFYKKRLGRRFKAATFILPNGHPQRHCLYFRVQGHLLSPEYLLALKLMLLLNLKRTI